MKRLFTALLMSFFAIGATAQVNLAWPPIPEQCENGPSFTLTGGLPAGGVYSGPGVSSSTFDPAVAGVGVHFLTYTYTDTSGTYDTSQFVTVFPAPSVGLASFGTICEDQSVVQLTQGSPAGGEYRGDGIYFDTFFFSDSVGGAGAYPIRYVFTDTTTGCADSASRNLVVNPLPPVNLLPFSGICDDQAAFNLVGGTPSGGVYVVNFQDTVSIFDPQVFGADSHLVTYTFTDAIGCSATDTAALVINADPTTPFILPWSPDTLLCSTEGQTYEWFRNDTALTQNVRFLPVPNQNGVYRVRVTTEGCTSEFSEDYNYGEWLGFDQFQGEKGIHLFPNPTSGLLTLSLSSNSPATVTLFNQLGEEVGYYQIMGSTQLDVSGFSEGVYFVQVAQGNSYSTHRLIIR